MTRLVLWCLAGAGVVCGCGNAVVGHGCPDEAVLCGSSCVDLQTSHGNCGACNRACADDEACSAGSCRGVTCGTGLSPCAGTCVDLRVDPANCGACARACAPGEACERGTCVADCLPGYVRCGDACVDTASDPHHCGSCDGSCTGGTVCEAGACRDECLPGQTDCAGACVDLTADPDNCGACGHACDINTPCVEGFCTRPCPSGTTDCGGTCVDLSGDPLNCGACAQACPEEDVCASGACTLSCPTGRAACGDACVDLGDDPAHCGRCDRACAPTETCFGGTCLMSCPDGFDDCGGSCVDLTTDPDNCGSCGHSCTTGICDSSACSVAIPGHVVLIGHDFARFRRPQMLLLANAVFLWVPVNPVRVAAFAAWTSTGSGTPANSADLAVSQAALERGRTWERTAFTDPATLAAALPDEDVVLIYEQALASDTELADAGAALAAPLAEFLGHGGIVIALDACTGNAGTWQLLDAAGLLAAAGCTDVTGARLDLLAPGDAVASGVPMSYVAERASVRFDSAELNQVVGDGTGPVVIHKVFLP